MSLRKSLLLKNILPAAVLTVIGFLLLRPAAHSLFSDLPALIIIVICCVLLVWIYVKPTERFDEMAKKSSSRAGEISFVACMVVVACLLLFSMFEVGHAIVLTSSALCFVLAGMETVNVAIFLLCDIKGGRQ